MIARLVTFGAVAIVWSLSNQSIAQSAPAPTAASNVVLNRRLASMALAPAPPSTLRPSMPEVLFSRTPPDQERKPNWLSSPAFMAIASRFTSVERLLHYRRGGVDANLWGVLNRSRSIRIEYMIRL